MLERYIGEEGFQKGIQLHMERHAEGSANASLLAAGIWQALLTTAAGLLVAIPAAVAAALLNARVERVAQQIETNVGRLFAAEDSRR